MSAFFTQRPYGFIILHCLVWWLTMLVAKPVFDSYGDMVEVYAWSQHWLAGSDKHPQLLPWATKIWFFFAPKSYGSFYFLSAINLAIGLFGIAMLGRALKFSEKQVLVALGLGVLALPYLTLSAKLNMNAISLATWPWVAWAFAKTFADDRRYSLGYAALFGFLAALSLLGKYYSVVLLLPLFILTFTPRYRPVWSTPAPWIAIGVTILTLAPHLVWLLNHPEAAEYASEQGAGDGLSSQASEFVKFVFSPVIYWFPSLLLALLLLAEGTLPSRCRTLLRWQRRSGPWPW